MALETRQSAGFDAKFLQEADAEPTAIKFVADHAETALRSHWKKH